MARRPLPSPLRRDGEKQGCAGLSLACGQRPRWLLIRGVGVLAGEGLVPANQCYSKGAGTSNSQALLPSLLLHHIPAAWSLYNPPDLALYYTLYRIALYTTLGDDVPSLTLKKKSALYFVRYEAIIPLDCFPFQVSTNQQTQTLLSLHLQVTRAG